MRTSAKTFNIKSGSCTIYRDRIEIYQNDLSGKIGKWLFKRNIYSGGPSYLLLALGLFLASGLAFFIQNYFLCAFLFATAVIGFFLFFQNRKLSFVPLVLRSQITQLKYHEAIPGKSRPFFEISFAPQPEDKPGYILVRKIVLPNTLHNGTSVADTAYWIMKDEGLINDRPE